MWTVQVMAELVESHKFALAHLPLSFLHQRTLFGGEDIVGIHDALRLHEDSVPVLGKCHEIALLHLEFFENLPRDDDLTALADAPDAFSR